MTFDNLFLDSSPSKKFFKIIIIFIICFSFSSAFQFQSDFELSNNNSKFNCSDLIDGNYSERGGSYYYVIEYPYLKMLNSSKTIRSTKNTTTEKYIIILKDNSKEEDHSNSNSSMISTLLGGLLTILGGILTAIWNNRNESRKSKFEWGKFLFEKYEKHYFRSEERRVGKEC